MRKIENFQSNGDKSEIFKLVIEYSALFHLANQSGGRSKIKKKENQSITFIFIFIASSRRPEGAIRRLSITTESSQYIDHSDESKPRPLIHASNLWWNIFFLLFDVSNDFPSFSSTSLKLQHKRKENRHKNLGFGVSVLMEQPSQFFSSSLLSTSNFASPSAPTSRSLLCVFAKARKTGMKKYGNPFGFIWFSSFVFPCAVPSYLLNCFKIFRHGSLNDQKKSLLQLTLLNHYSFCPVRELSHLSSFTRNTRRKVKAN